MAAIIQLALFSRQHWAAKLELVLNSHRKEAVGGLHTVQAACQPFTKFSNFLGTKLRHMCSHAFVLRAS